MAASRLQQRMRLWHSEWFETIAPQKTSAPIGVRPGEARHRGRHYPPMQLPPVDITAYAGVARPGRPGRGEPPQRAQGMT